MLMFVTAKAIRRFLVLNSFLRLISQYVFLCAMLIILIVTLHPSMAYYAFSRFHGRFLFHSSPYMHDRLPLRFHLTAGIFTFGFVTFSCLQLSQLFPFLQALEFRLLLPVLSGYKFSKVGLGSFGVLRPIQRTCEIKAIFIYSLMNAK